MRPRPSGELEAFVSTTRDRAELEPEELSWRLRCWTPPRRENEMASPGGFEPPYSP